MDYYWDSFYEDNDIVMYIIFLFFIKCRLSVCYYVDCFIEILLFFVF